MIYIYIYMLYYIILYYIILYYNSYRMAECFMTDLTFVRSSARVGPPDMHLQAVSCREHLVTLCTRVTPTFYNRKCVINFNL